MSDVRLHGIIAMLKSRLAEIDRQMRVVQEARLRVVSPRHKRQRGCKKGISDVKSNGTGTGFERCQFTD